MRRRRAMIMIFVSMMLIAITTIIMASVDVGRMAITKQRQIERDGKWQLCLDSAKAYVTANLVSKSTYTQSFNLTVNNITLKVDSALSTWQTPYGVQTTVKGTLDGKSKTSTLYFGKRATVQPCQFGLFFTSAITPTGSVSNTGDLYYYGSIDGSMLTIGGDVYSPDTTSPTFSSLTGSFIGRQPGFKISLDDTAYANSASVTTSGDTTLTNPSSLLAATQSQLRYHTGNLTIRGTITGEITIFVKGTATIKAVTPLTNILSRLVVICDGDVYLDTGTSGVFVICTGMISSTSSGGNRIVNGSLAGSILKNTDGGNGSLMTINFDNYFVANTNGGYRYWIPGQW
ncbi:MAG: hypothetical protein GC165_18300 [Armatimonadetes bacterium]|nr:hypothetical protein [Armatimonadota bacterium]